jgi:hypothetical protein
LNFICILKKIQNFKNKIFYSFAITISFLHFHFLSASLSLCFYIPPHFPVTTKFPLTSLHTKYHCKLTAVHIIPQQYLPLPSTYHLSPFSQNNQPPSHHYTPLPQIPLQLQNHHHLQQTITSTNHQNFHKYHITYTKVPQAPHCSLPVAIAVHHTTIPNTKL